MECQNMIYIITIAILQQKNHRKIQTKVTAFIYVCLTKRPSTTNFRHV